MEMHSVKVDFLSVFCYDTIICRFYQRVLLCQRQLLDYIVFMIDE